MGGQRVDDGRSNLQRFLDCTTPAVETHILPKVTPPLHSSRPPCSLPHDLRRRSTASQGVLGLVITRS
jgi:hypothetical protein